MEFTIKVENIFSIFTNLITNIQRCINKIKDTNMKALGLKSGHVSCLYYLYKIGPMSQAKLCEICEEDKSAISRKVEYLTQNDYLEKNSFDDGKYKQPIILTKKGKEVSEFISDKINEVIQKADSELNDNDRQLLYTSLEKINDKLKKIINEEKK